MEVLKLPPSKNQTFSLVLDGRIKRFKFRFNRRYTQWSMCLYEADGTPIVEGISVVGQYPLLEQYVANPKVPQNMLVVGPEDPETFDAAMTIYYIEVSRG